MTGPHRKQNDGRGLLRGFVRGDDPRTPFVAFFGVNVLLALLVLAISLVALAAWLLA